MILPEEKTRLVELLQHIMMVEYSTLLLVQLVIVTLEIFL